MSWNRYLFKWSIKCESKIKVLSHKQGLNFPPSNTVRTKRKHKIYQNHIHKYPLLSVNKIRTWSTWSHIPRKVSLLTCPLPLNRAPREQRDGRLWTLISLLFFSTVFPTLSERNSPGSRYKIDSCELKRWKKA